MDMADWNGVPFRAGLSSADRLREAAIRAGSFQVKTPYSNAKAWLSLVTRADQERVFFFKFSLD